MWALSDLEVYVHIGTSVVKTGTEMAAGQVLRSQSGTVTCTCNHLTNFAVLVV